MFSPTVSQDLVTAEVINDARLTSSHEVSETIRAALAECIDYKDQVKGEVDTFSTYSSGFYTFA